MVLKMDFEQENWWKYLNGALQESMRQSLDLLEREKERLASGKFLPYHDYSFVIFPAAKAYEGFLKSLFLDMQLITKQQFHSEHFRIGRALSPNLPKRYRHGWVYGKLSQYCQGDTLPLQMWNTWKQGRNQVFHYFPDMQGWISLNQAEELVLQITTTMKAALLGCRTH